MRKSILFKFALSLLMLFSSSSSSSKDFESFSNPSWIVEAPKESLKTSLFKSFKKNCSKGKDFASENLIYSAALLGDTSLISAIEKEKLCRQKSLKAEELFCEYFCAHDFSISYLKIKKGERKPPPLEPESFGTFSDKKTVSDVVPYLSELKDSELIESISNSKKTTAQIKKMNFNKRLYEFSVYYELGRRHSSEEAKKFLFRRLMELAPNDASGDGGVNQIERALYQFAGKG